MFEFIASPIQRPKADLTIVPFFKGKKGAELASFPDDLKDEIALILKMGDFTGKMEATCLSYVKGKKELRLLLLGLGEKEKCTPEILRRSFSAAMKRGQNKKWHHINVFLPKKKELSEEEIARAVCEGIGLTLYLFEEYKSKENQTPFHVKKVVIIGSSKKELGVKIEGILSGVNLARCLINENALTITPQALAHEAKVLAKSSNKISVKIVEEKELEKEGMGLFLAVGSGSRIPPVLICLEYKGDGKSKERTLIIGKGVTFDTGGLNLKPTGFMEDMKADMSGAAAALGIVKAADAIGLKANLVILIAATENAIDAKSYKPGDVYRSASGKTVEIANTDAEGRLTLADALTYGQKHYAPTRIVDMATLTGSVVVALGTFRSGLFTNNCELGKLCEEAGEETGERVWKLPLDPEYKEELKSEIADLRNCGSKWGGSITAATFLHEFIENQTPWIHLDIAGTAYLDKMRWYHCSFATGVGVRLVIELLEKLHSRRR
ncbi:MAG: leucyl aminopeptidase [Simkania negevensis]|nr:leucyl aminopeptidase [Simkania negevensis]